MKNKWTKVVVMILLGFISISLAKNMNGNVVGSILQIVGTILLIVGVVEMFKRKPKVEEQSSNTNNSVSQ